MSQENSLQRIFDAAWEHFIVKDNPPAIEEGSCKYLTSDGRKCAIGLCIPDGHPAQNFDDMFNGLVYEYPELFPDLVEEGSDYLDEFQERLHDQLQKSGEWKYSKEERKKCYLQVAKDYDLTVPSEAR